MKSFARASFALTFLAITTMLEAQEAAKEAEPAKEYRLLKQMVGEWESEFEAIAGPGQPAEKSKGTETVRAIGQFWVVAENKASAMGVSFTGVLTVGYEAEKKKYVGTWIDSMNSRMVTYDGTLDDSGNVLTLHTEQANPMAGGKLSKFKDVLEIKSKDHKVLTSSVQGDDGKWVTYLTVNYRRKK